MTSATAAKFGRRRDGLYYLPEGRKYPSVTTILSVLAKPALIHWAAKTAAARILEDPERFDTAEKAAAAIYDARDKAGDRGSMVHSLIEALFRGSPVETESMPELVRGYYMAFWRWAEALKPVPLFAEANVFSDTNGYAGTTDLIAAFPDKKIRLVDFKTSGAIYPEVGLQVEAYRHAEFILQHGSDKTLPMPPISETAVVLLGQDGMFTYRVIQGDLRVFLALKRVWEWSQSVK